MSSFLARTLTAPKFDVVATAGDGRAVLEAAERYKPDLILLDISMPGLNGIEAARRLCRSNPGAKLIMLTMHADLSSSPRLSMRVFPVTC